MKRPLTPFPTTGYFGPTYFCDRENELDQLIRNCSGGNSTTLIALRRLGKTALIRHLFHHVNKDFVTIYLDILATESLGDLLNKLSSAIAGIWTERSAPGQKAWKMIRSLRPVISYDALSGAPIVSVKSTPEESKKTIAELLAFLEKQQRPVLVAIDEFQQILEYPEEHTDAWLRSLVQNLGNVNFIFSGSQQHIMRELFTDPGRPFYRSTQFLKIGKIDPEIYANFIAGHFRRRSRPVDDQVIKDILKWADGHTYYVQLLCNRIFLSKSRKITPSVWKEEASRILKEQEFVFFGYREMLTKNQWSLLKAVASEGPVYHPTNATFISTHALGSSASVLRSLDALLRMELVYKEQDEKGKSYYGVYDILFSRWISGIRSV